MSTDHEGPFARQPYSADTILADLMIDPAARAVLDRLAPDLLRAPAAFGGGPLPAGMATILSPRAVLSHWQPRPAALIEQIDRELAAVPLTPSARPWDWYAETLIGARFVGHPMPPHQFQPGSYTHPPSARLLECGIAWAMGLDSVDEEIAR
jgi:hypothetical protein